MKQRLFSAMLASLSISCFLGLSEGAAIIWGNTIAAVDEEGNPLEGTRAFGLVNLRNGDLLQLLKAVGNVDDPLGDSRFYGNPNFTIDDVILDEVHAGYGLGPPGGAANGLWCRVVDANISPGDVLYVRAFNQPKSSVSPDGQIGIRDTEGKIISHTVTQIDAPATYVFDGLQTLAYSLAFSVADRVRTVDALNVRHGPGATYALVGTMPIGSTGTIVISNPWKADGFTWWQVKWDSGLRGWSSEHRLEKVGSVPVVVDLLVPMVHQVWDTPEDFDGRHACGATSAVMVAASYGRLDPWPETIPVPHAHTSDYGQYVSRQYTTPLGYILGDEEDEVTPDASGNPSRGAYGYIHYADHLAKLERAVTYFTSHGLTSHEIYNPSEATVRAELDAGYPVAASTCLTTAGHWVVLKGYTSDGHYVVNDPFGAGPEGLYGSLVYAGGYGNFSGADVLYTWEEMKVYEKWIAVARPEWGPQGTLAVGSTTLVQGNQTSFLLPVSLNFPHDLSYLALTVEFRADLFEALDYTEAGRVQESPVSGGIDNTNGTVRIAWLGLAGETMVPAGNGEIATIEFRQIGGAGEGAYALRLANVEASYGPQDYDLQLVDGELRVVDGTLDVDGNGAVAVATDVVYIYRGLIGMPAIVPSTFRELDPSIPSDPQIQQGIDALLPFLDVDASGGAPNAATDIVYVYRYLLGMPSTVPSKFRELDPSIPADAEINARIDAINAPGTRATAPRLPTGTVGSGAESAAGVLKTTYAICRAGQSMVVPISLDAPDEDLSYLRLWLRYDYSKLTPTDLQRTGRTSIDPMSDWLDPVSGLIRVAVESLTGDVVIPKGTGPVVEIVFDVHDDTTTLDSLEVEGNAEAGLGPRVLALSVLPPVEMTLTPTGAMVLRWGRFGTRSYTVLYCDDLSTAGWMPGEGADWPILETNWQSNSVTDVRRRFYRVASP